MCDNKFRPLSRSWTELPTDTSKHHRLDKLTKDTYFNI